MLCWQVGWPLSHVPALCRPRLWSGGGAVGEGGGWGRRGRVSVRIGKGEKTREIGRWFESEGKGVQEGVFRNEAKIEKKGRC